MKISRYNVKITVQKQQMTSDEIGRQIESWNDHFTCHAYCLSKSASESNEAGIIVDNGKADFTVRYCKKYSGINTTEYRIVFDGELYNIIGIDRMNYNRKEVKYICQRVRR